jgi:hypothetical protein
MRQEEPGAARRSKDRFLLFFTIDVVLGPTLCSAGAPHPMAQARICPRAVSNRRLYRDPFALGERTNINCARSS